MPVVFWSPTEPTDRRLFFAITKPNTKKPENSENSENGNTDHHHRRHQTRKRDLSDTLSGDESEESVAVGKRKRKRKREREDEDKDIGKGKRICRERPEFEKTRVLETPWERRMGRRLAVGLDKEDEAD
ncbi:hypothetical protein EX30DRAFT_344467 [Ascodesmis nigricans]|uniref:Uncharacterized protein n=1 Tax=Ascodesmis nigricans TaxID=341454 RepID=A0A4S2MQW4_9PEZI|nr:hypothetical protein EX30DRAFT_344467 [Ascodesmis nigricans]